MTIQKKKKFLMSDEFQLKHMEIKCAKLCYMLSLKYLTKFFSSSHVSSLSPVLSKLLIIFFCGQILFCVYLFCLHKFLLWFSTSERLFVLWKAVRDFYRKMLIFELFLFDYSVNAERSLLIEWIFNGIWTDRLTRTVN